jgi:nucleoside-diphosphate-sugar epimerase
MIMAAFSFGTILISTGGNDAMSQHVLITGGAGYLGSILCEHLLNRNYRVTALDNLMYAQKSLFHLMSHPGFEFIFGDTRDKPLVEALVAKADVLIPLASVVGAPACARDPWLAESVNDGVRLVCSLSGRDQLIIYPTTNSGYGTKSGDVYCTEETPLEPISKYGVEKVALEKEVLEHPSAITLRLATVFGMSPRMRMDLLVNHFTWMAVSDGTITIFEKDFKRNYIHIRDVADCFIHCIEKRDEMAGGAFNAGLDEANLSKAELALKIKEQVPGFYIHFAEVGSDPDKRNYIVSNDKLRKTGFEAARSLDSGIAELIKGYRMMVRDPFKNV